MSPRKQRPKMPTLNWIGKNAVVNHHKDVPFRLLEPVPEFSCPPLPLGEGAGVRESGNLIVRGDNMHALKALWRCEHSVILWLVPSKPIREQTLRALRNRRHPYHAALREAGPITVLDLDDAKSVTRATLDTSTTIIIATRQAFQVNDIMPWACGYGSTRRSWCLGLR